MNDAGGVALAVAAVALWISAVPARAPTGWRLKVHRLWPATARLLGGAAAALSAAVLAAGHGSVSGACLAAAAVTGAASLAILALPLAPRPTWAVLAASPPLAVILLAAGAVGG
jgi:hypothetical protein